MFMSAIFKRNQWKYPDSAAYRTLILDAGHMCQTFCLTATWLGLAPFCTMALADSKVEKDLGLDGISESLVYAAGVGTKPQKDWAPCPEPGVKLTKVVQFRVVSIAETLTGETRLRPIIPCDQSRADYPCMSAHRRKRINHYVTKTSHVKVHVKWPIESNQAKKDTLRQAQPPISAGKKESLAGWRQALGKVEVRSCRNGFYRAATSAAGRF